MKPYVEQIHASYCRDTGSKLSLEAWLDKGDNGRGWRKPLKTIGERAAKIVPLEPAVALDNWRAFCAANEWVSDLFNAAPLLDGTALQTRIGGEDFMEFMRNLATLANL